MGIAPLHGSVNDFVAQMLVEQHNDKRRRVLGMLWDICRFVIQFIVKEDACWCKPTSEMVKYNVGGVDSGYMGWVVVVRNDVAGWMLIRLHMFWQWGALFRADYIDCIAYPTSIVDIVNAEKMTNLDVNE
ncbi:hypothetical protein Goklo_025131, partial [Gossypium klotzschianum]|nr:hypothetical protein [Gossypium klotzschianum]